MNDQSLNLYNSNCTRIKKKISFNKVSTEKLKNINRLRHFQKYNRIMMININDHSQTKLFESCLRTGVILFSIDMDGNFVLLLGKDKQSRQYTDFAGRRKIKKENKLLIVKNESDFLNEKYITVVTKENIFSGAIRELEEETSSVICPFIKSTDEKINIITIADNENVVFFMYYDYEDFIKFSKKFNEKTNYLGNVEISEFYYIRLDNLIQDMAKMDFKKYYYKLFKLLNDIDIINELKKLFIEDNYYSFQNRPINYI